MLGSDCMLAFVTGNSGTMQMLAPFSCPANDGGLPSHPSTTFVHPQHSSAHSIISLLHSCILLYYIRVDYFKFLYKFNNSPHLLVMQTSMYLNAFITYKSASINFKISIWCLYIYNYNIQYVFLQVLHKSDPDIYLKLTNIKYISFW